MNKVWATLRTLGILVGLWVILAIVGLIAGAIPSAEEWFRSLWNDDAVASGPDAGTGVAAPDAGEGRDAGPPSAPPRDAGTGAPTRGALTTTTVEPTPTPTARWTLCPLPEGGISLGAGHLFADASDELVVGCGEGFRVVGLTPTGPMVVADLRFGAGRPNTRARPADAAFGDIDGDGQPDLLLPLAYETEAGATRGGALYWVPTGSLGGLRSPTVLAEIAAVSIALADLDGQPGLDFAVLNRTNSLAQLPSEAWLFAGGPSPARTNSVSGRPEGLAVAVADVDLDGSLDVVSLSRGHVHIHFGGGETPYAREHGLDIAGAGELATGDLDGDGGTDLVVLGEGIRWLRAGPVEVMEPRGVDGVPSALRELSVRDFDRDGKLDLVGWDHPRLVVLRQHGELRFIPRVVIELATAGFALSDYTLFSVEGAERDSLALLGTFGGPSPQLELIVVDGATLRGFGTRVALAEQAQALPEAPLRLRAELN